MNNRKLISRMIILIYFGTRLFIWVYRPVEFTEIIYSYMPYAHRWASGEVPYLQMWYEYPPGTIPLFYLPHIFDMKTLGMPIHLSYLQAYRGMLLLIDIGLFVLIWKTLKKYKVSKSVLAGGLIYYSLATAKAHTFVYDSVDLTFASALALSVSGSLLIKNYPGYFTNWFGYFLAVALKLLNAPMAIIYALLERNYLKRLLVTLSLALILVWIIPLSYYRSSLLVMVEYHKQRGIQVESAPAVIASAIDTFTNSEEFIEAYKNYEIVGPVSAVVKSIYDILFWASIALFLVLSSRHILRSNIKDYQFLRHSLTLLYIFILMSTSKVLSTPILLWHVPLLAMIPFKDLKTQLLFCIPSIVIIALSMTKIEKVDLFIFDIHQYIGLIRTILFLYLTVMSIRMVKGNYVKKD